MKAIFAGCMLVGLLSLFASAGESGKSPAIPFERLGAEAQQKYSGDGVSIARTPDGARLRADFQKLEADATTEGLWLTSTEANGGRFRVRANSVSRDGQPGGSLVSDGVIHVEEKTASFIRPGLTEEYSVSMDGVRQDFLVSDQPEGTGPLVVSLDVTGSRAAATSYGAKLVLDVSGREIAYHRLVVTDATGRELAARIEVPAEREMRVSVDDSNAVYPVRIDPTFCDCDWISMSGMPGLEGGVYAILPDGLGNIYVGGNFTAAGEVSASKVAKWDGSSWGALGPGLDGDVNALALVGTLIYAGGDFSGGVACWNGTAWSTLREGTNGNVNSLAALGGELYVGGSFSTAGIVSASNIALWSGGVWSALGSGANDTVLTMAVSGFDVYVGGEFTSAGGVANTTRIARWDGAAWNALGSGMDDKVTEMVVSGGYLYAGGEFNNAGGVASSFLARWQITSSTWLAIPSPGPGIFLGFPHALAVADGELYVAATFNFGSGDQTMAKWNTSSEVWSTLPIAPYNIVLALATSGSDVIAAGFFHNIGLLGAGAGSIARWDGTSWHAYGSGFNGGIHTTLVVGSDLYVGGYFTSTPSGSANRIAKWDGSTWSALGTGTDQTVLTLAEWNGSIYAGGNFFNAGGIPVNFIARWNPLTSSWSSLAPPGLGAFPGTDSNVNALVATPSRLYVGGFFLETSGLPNNRIAAWDGTNWSSLGSGTPGQVFALAVSGSDVIAGGGFLSMGGVANTENIARWDGSTWHALGTGVDGTVYSIAASGASVYAGGFFQNAGGNPANNIARWEGGTWSPLGAGTDALVDAIAISGSDLYVGGNVANAGGNPASRIAKWDSLTSTWSALGSGLNERVLSLSIDGGSMFVGGFFTSAGCHVSRALARFDLTPESSGPEISIVGNNLEISSGDTTPSPADGTDLGATPIGGYASSGFEIRNTGHGTLTLTGSPSTRITLSPADGPFSISAQSLPGTIPACDGVATFSVNFQPTLSEHAGFQTATVTIKNDDEDESPYTFTVRACGISPVFSDGRLDPAFDGDGKVVTAVTDGALECAYAAAEQADGKIVVAGKLSLFGNSDILLARYLADGSLDTTFGDGGAVYAPVGIDNDVAYAIVIQPDGKIVVAGSTVASGNEDFAVLRFLTNGSLDPDFGDGGVATKDIGGLADRALALALLPDGSIYVAGTSYNGSNWDFAAVRYQANGVVDETFGGGGARYNFAGGDDEAHEILVQSDGLIVLAGTAGGDFGLLRLDSYGVLDSTFGSFGRVTTDFSGGTDRGWSAALLDNNSIIVAGDSDEFVAMARYFSNGSLDPDFGIGGKSVSHSGIAYDVARLPDGNFVVGGWHHDVPLDNRDFMLARFLPNGTPDSTFDGDGLVTTDITSASHDDEARAMVIQCDGNIVLAGFTEDGGDSDLALARYTLAPAPEIRLTGNDMTIPDGDTTPDLADHTAFGIVGLGESLTRTFTIHNQGTSDLSLTGGPGNYVKVTSISGSAFSVTAQPVSGTVPVGGFLTFGITFAPTSPADIISQLATVKINNDDFDENPYNFDIAACGARFSDGSQDPTFGAGGIVVPSGPGSDGVWAAVAVQDDGKIVTAGSGNNPGTGSIDFMVARHLPNGDPDGDFSGGVVYTAFLSSYDTATCVAIQEDGKIVVGGITGNGSTEEFALARYLTNGNLDPDFGVAGRVISVLSSGDDSPTALKLDPEGRIVVVGRTGNATALRSDFAVVRYLPDGSLDDTFGSGGIATTDFGNNDDIPRSLAFSSGGDIVVAGDTYDLVSTRIAIAKYHADGSPDLDFSADGQVTTDLGPANDSAYGVHVQDDGTIVVAGYASTIGEQSNFAVLHYLPNGSLDSSFDSDGIVTVDFETGDDFALASVLQSDGRLILAGEATVSGRKKIGMIRLLPNGSLDPDFGLNGRVTTQVADSDDDYGTAIALQCDGKIVLAGYTAKTIFSSPSNRPVIVRYSTAEGEIAVSGNGLEITSGDITPDLADHTDFGSACATHGTVARVFTIANNGPGELNLTGTPLVKITGSNAADFMVTTTPSSPVASSGSTTFTITFDPGDFGPRTATVSISSDDSDENPYTFAIQGTGLTPAEVFEMKMLDAGLIGPDTAPLATPKHDGVSNLLKFAFNMNLSGPDVSVLATGGESGLPRITLEGSGPSRVLRYEFVRRTSCGDLDYAPQKSTDLSPGSWLPLTDTPDIFYISDDWERVVYEEPAPEGSEPRLLGRVSVNLP